MTVIGATKYEDLRDRFREGVLQAMDDAVRFAAMEAGVHASPYQQPGAIDADLPALFEVLDAQFARAMERLDIEAEYTGPTRGEQRPDA